MKPIEHERRQKNAELYRKHGWRQLWSEPVGNQVTGEKQWFTLECWAKDWRLSLVQVWPDSQGLTNFFEGGGSTWDELEEELKK